jgi:fido (protein-threonine AMPylation protein)
MDESDRSNPEQPDGGEDEADGAALPEMDYRAAFVPETLMSDPKRRAAREAENGILQFDFARSVICKAIASPGASWIDACVLIELNRLAIEGVMTPSGSFRRSPVFVGNHEPPHWTKVPRLVDEMFQYLNDCPASPIHLSAYALWRLNWIHPFVDGNGRTSRILSYMVLCIGEGIELPGTNTIPDQIAATKHALGIESPYYKGLRAADEAWKDGRVDVALLEKMLDAMLLNQLRGYRRDQ